MAARTRMQRGESAEPLAGIGQEAAAQLPSCARGGLDAAADQDAGRFQ